MYTKEKIINIIESEGLEYAILNYMTLEKIPDDLRLLVSQIRKSFEELETILRDKYGYEW